MTTSNNDRISSRRLLDTLKGLQVSRHLGSEPEVVTETVEYPAVVSPAAGTYNDVTAFRQEMASKQVNENRLPIKIYTTPSNPNTNPVFPLTINEPSGAYVEADKKIKWHNFDGYANEEVADENTYTGYMVLNMAGMWAGYHIENGTPDNNQYQWEMPAYTETTTTKTKHTIKQDYVPNADWNVNDPDADGYVKGRTHWVEVGTIDKAVDSSGDEVVFDTFAKPLGYSWDGGEWYPDFEAAEISIEGVECYLLAIDENGNQLTEFYESVITNSLNFVIIADYSQIDDGSIPTVLISKYPANTVRVVDEIVHKLDKKFYEQFTLKPSEYHKMDYSIENNLNDNYLGENCGYSRTVQYAFRLVTDFDQFTHNFCAVTGVEYFEQSGNEESNVGKSLMKSLNALLRVWTGDLTTLQIKQCNKTLNQFVNSLDSSLHIVVTYTDDSTEVFYKDTWVDYVDNVGSQQIKYKSDNSELTIGSMGVNMAANDFWRCIGIRMTNDFYNNVKDIFIVFSYNPQSIFNENVIDIHPDIDNQFENLQANVENLKNYTKIVPYHSGKIIGVKDANGEYKQCWIDWQGDSTSFSLSNWTDDGNNLRYRTEWNYGTAASKVPLDNFRRWWSENGTMITFNNSGLFVGYVTEQDDNGNDIGTKYLPVYVEHALSLFASGGGAESTVYRINKDDLPEYYANSVTVYAYSLRCVGRE